MNDLHRDAMRPSWLAGEWKLMVSQPGPLPQGDRLYSLLSALPEVPNESTRWRDYELLHRSNDRFWISLEWIDCYLKCPPRNWVIYGGRRRHPLCIDCAEEFARRWVDPVPPGTTFHVPRGIVLDWLIDTWSGRTTADTRSKKQVRRARSRYEITLFDGRIS